MSQIGCTDYIETTYINLSEPNICIIVHKRLINVCGLWIQMKGQSWFADNFHSHCYFTCVSSNTNCRYRYFLVYVHVHDLSYRQKIIFHVSILHFNYNTASWGLSIIRVCLFLTQKSGLLRNGNDSCEIVNSPLPFIAFMDYHVGEKREHGYIYRPSYTKILEVNLFAFGRIQTN